MSAVFAGIFPVPAGIQESSVFSVTPGITTATASMDGSVFPVGSVVIDVFFSYDNGVTFPRSASLTANGPIIKAANGRGGVYSITYGTADQPTHAKFRTTSPSSFSTQTTLSVG